MAKQERDQEPPDPPVSVEEWMDRLELNVCKTGANQVWHRWVTVEEALEVAHALGDAVVRWRNECGVSWTRPSNPVLRPPELARLLGASPPT